MADIFNNFFGSYSSAPSWSNTKQLYLDGVNEYGTAVNVLPTLAAVDTGMISYWFETPTPATQRWHFGYSITTANTYIVTQHLGSRIYISCYINGSQKFTIRSNVVISANTRYHVAITQDGGIIKIYINNVNNQSNLNLSAPFSWFDSFAANSLTLGTLFYNNTQTGYFTGNFDELLITNGVPSAAIVSDVYNGGTPKDESGRANKLFYCQFGDNASDNFNSDVANQWRLYDSDLTLYMDTVNCEADSIELI